MVGGHHARRGKTFTFIPPIVRLKLCYRVYSMQQANSPYGRGHRGKKFCSSANVSFTFALKIFVLGVKEWYIKNAKISVFNTTNIIPLTKVVANNVHNVFG